MTEYKQIYISSALGFSGAGSGNGSRLRFGSTNIFLKWNALCKHNHRRFNDMNKVSSATIIFPTQKDYKLFLWCWYSFEICSFLHEWVFFIHSLEGAGIKSSDAMLFFHFANKGHRFSESFQSHLMQWTSFKYDEDLYFRKNKVLALPIMWEIKSLLWCVKTQKQYMTSQSSLRMTQFGHQQ